MLSSEGKAKRVRIERGGYPIDGPVIWAAANAFKNAGWEIGSDDAQAAICHGTGCLTTGDLPGVYLAPPIADPEFYDRLRQIKGPLLVVGSVLANSWVPAQAARIRNAEILQLFRVNEDFVVEGDLSATLDALKRISARIEALVVRL
jgi:hypothetical protein